MRPPVAADALLVIDAGTSALRAVAVSADGTAKTIAREPWRMLAPVDAAPFGRELDAAHVRRSLATALDAAAASATRFAGLAFTGQREGLVFVDRSNEPLLVSPNVDARASSEGMAIDAQHGEEVYRATGHLPSLMQAPAKLAWLKEHRPGPHGRVHHAMPLADWLASTLTGEMVASRSLLAENGMLDIAGDNALAAAWSSIDTPVDIIPPFIVEGSCAGKMREGALAGLPVVLCGGDTQCALVGTGAVDAGSAGVASGWSAPVQVVTAAPVLDGRRRTWTGVHVVPDRWVVESNAGETGRAWQWLLSMLGITTTEAEADASRSPLGARDVMAVLGPARMNAAAMGAGAGGITLPLPLVMSAPERCDLLRAVLESIACAIRANLAQAELVAGVTASELKLGGGMSQSAVFAQIVADMVDRPVMVASTPETSALGAAVLAAPVPGVHDSVADALAAMVRSPLIVPPDARGAVAYEDVYQRWLAMCETFESMP
jgi:autoinducer 2 (AI-2) kinase